MSSFSVPTQFLSFSLEARAAFKRLGQLSGLPARLPSAEESLHRLVPVHHLGLSVVYGWFVCLLFQVITAMRPLVFVSLAALLASRRPWRPPLWQVTHINLFFSPGSAPSRTERNWTKLIPVSHCASSLCCFVCLFFSLILSVSLRYPRGCFPACACVLARYVSCQPWSRFLLRCLLDSGESCLLHPATLRLIALVRVTHLHAQTRAWHESSEISLPQGWWGPRGGPERW